jgi:oxaloacetate decarboxylase alpha subunit
MAHVEFIDQTLRDGQQSLWGMRMQAGMALPVTPLIDRVGYRVVDLTGSSMFEVLIKYCHEDPWAGLDLLTASMPNSRVRAGMRSNGCVTFAVTPDAVMDLWVRRLAAHGIRSFWIYDVLFNIDKMHRLAKVAKESGAEVAGAINFSLSPVHTDAYYAARAAELSASPDIDTLLVYDTAGCLLPERVPTLVPAIRSGARGKPIELHSHNVTGMSALSYLEAVKQGVTILHTATRPLANGPSMPSTEMMIRNLALLGHSHELDERLMRDVADHFTRIARTYGFRVGIPNEFDLSAYEHQIPGGMTGTLRNQLVQHRMGDRLDEVLRETAVVRREFGYPGMMTPFSQLVGTQAILNIVTGKRYSVIPDEVIKYAVGHYGKPVAPIQPEIVDRISSARRYREILAHPPPQPTLEDLRREHGGVDDDELLLRAVVPRHDIERMRAAGPLRLEFPTLASPELDFARELMQLTSSRYMRLATAGIDVELRR